MHLYEAHPSTEFNSSVSSFAYCKYQNLDSYPVSPWNYLPKDWKQSFPKVDKGVISVLGNSGSSPSVHTALAPWDFVRARRSSLLFTSVCSLGNSVMSNSLWPPWTVACQAPLSMEFSWQKYWSGLPFPFPGGLPNPGIKPESLESPELTGKFFTTVPSGKSLLTLKFILLSLHLYFYTFSKHFLSELSLHEKNSGRFSIHFLRPAKFWFWI